MSLRAVKVVWHREILRFVKDRPRVIAGLAQPVLYLFVMGTGLGTMIPSASGVSFRTFLFPGVLTMAVLFTCFFSAGTIVWDREHGFMREMLVAPVSRTSILLGKCLGGMTVGAFQGTMMIGIGALSGVPITARLAAVLLAELLLVCFAISAVAVAVAVATRTIQGFMAVMQVALLPMFIASGALYPLSGLPWWLEIATRLDPLTYVVTPLRHAVLDAAGHGATSPMVTWGSFLVPIELDLAIVAGAAILALALAVPRFAKSEG